MRVLSEGLGDVNMDRCKDCIHYVEDNFFDNAGYCSLYEAATSDEGVCEDYEDNLTF